MTIHRFETLLKCLLEMEGFHLTEAGSAEEASIALSVSEVDMVITDIQMPVITGLELASTVRETRPEVPILLMSGAPPADIGRDLWSDCFFLEKPFSFANLMGKIELALAV
jgi:two-component system NtrC family response regulator